MNESQKAPLFEAEKLLTEIKFTLLSLRREILNMDSNDFISKILKNIDSIVDNLSTVESFPEDAFIYLHASILRNDLISNTLSGGISVGEFKYLGNHIEGILFSCVCFGRLNITLFNEKLGNAILREENNKYINDSKKNQELEYELSAYRNAEKNQKAQNIYNEANKRHGDKETIYRRWFVGVLIVSVLITLGYDPNFTILANLANLWNSITSTVPAYNQIAYFDSLKTPVTVLHDYSFLKFIFFKIATLFVGITLSTYFLKLSNYYRSLKDQAHQTKLELEAFPDYVAGLDHEVTNRLREELALKYFGQELDRSVNDKLGNLVQDQISAGTELVKASAELIKVKDSLSPK